MAHAKLSPSSSHRWIHCPGSVALSETVPEPPSSSYAEEGTLAHALVEHLLTHNGDMPEHGAYTDEMIDGAMFMCEYIFEQRTNRTVDVFVEEKVEVTKEVWGTADCVIWEPSTRHLECVDFKFGKGLRVDPWRNPQLMLYAIGAAKSLNVMPIDVTITIVQPRNGGVSSWQTTGLELRTWFTDVLKPAIEATKQPNARRNPSVDACRWCPAKTVCPEMTTLAIETARREFKVEHTPEDLTRLAELIPLADLLEDWAKAVREEAHQVIVVYGQDVPGYKRVEGRCIRQWTDEQAAARAMIEAGAARVDVVVEKTIGIPAAEKLAKKLDRLDLDQYIVKPRGKPTWAPESDKRPAIPPDLENLDA